MSDNKEKWFKAIDETERRWMAWYDGTTSRVPYGGCKLCRVTNELKDSIDVSCCDEDICVFSFCFPNSSCVDMRETLRAAGRTEQVLKILTANFAKMRDYVKGMK